MFNAEGNFNVVITQGMIAECKFDNDKSDPNAFDVCLLLETTDPAQPKQSDWWRGACSNRYGAGNMADKTQTEITLAALEKVGVQNQQHLMAIAGADFAELKGVNTIVGVTSRIHNNKTYYTPQYLGNSSMAPNKFDANEVQRRMSAMMQPPAAAPTYGAQPPQQPAQQPAQQYAAPQQPAPGGFPAMPGQQPQQPAPGGSFQPPAPTQPGLPGQALPGQPQTGHAG